MDLVDWLLVHDRWLRSRSGTPDGPSPELMAAWSCADWLKVSWLCEEWMREVGIGPLTTAPTQADRDRVVHDLYLPIRTVKTVALTMSGGTDHARGIQKLRTRGALDRLEIVLDSAFKAYAENAGEDAIQAWLEGSLAARVDQLVDIFVDANDDGLDLSVSRADIEIGDR
jgi:hypothetical protein